MFKNTVSALFILLMSLGFVFAQESAPVPPVQDVETAQGLLYAERMHKGLDAWSDDIERSIDSEIKLFSSPHPGFAVREIGGQIVVGLVVRGGPAEKAGITPGDIVREINGQTITDMKSIPDSVLQEDKMEFVVERTVAGEKAIVRVSLKSEVIPCLKNYSDILTQNKAVY